MTPSEHPPDRFRSATEFPKATKALDRAKADLLYEEMRACLIFTNRSRAQLIRRNEEHKQSALKLKADVGRLQTLISQLSLEKQQSAQRNQLIVAELEQEMSAMSGHLNQLSVAFEQVADIENSNQAQWGFFALPRRFFNFIQAVRTIVLQWRDDNNDVSDQPQLSGRPQPTLSDRPESDDDRRDRPQMYDDPASQGRSLLDR